MVISESNTMLVFQGIRELAETHLKLSTMLGIIEEMCDEIIDEDAEIVVRRKLTPYGIFPLPESRFGLRFRLGLKTQWLHSVIQKFFIVWRSVPKMVQ